MDPSDPEESATIIIFFVSHGVSREGQALREVKCEHCSEEYVYVLKIRLTEWNTTPEEAQANAEALYTRLLDEGVDIAPCPSCGWLQQHMFVEARRRKRGDPILLVSSLLIAAGMILPIGMLTDNRHHIQMSPQQIQSSIAMIVIGLPFVIWRAVVDYRWNPNKAPIAERLAVAAKISVKRADFLAKAKSEEGSVTQVVVNPSNESGVVKKG